MWSKVRSYLKNILIMLLVLAAAYCLCILLNRISESDFLPDKIIFVNVDYMLIGQVINNILINSCLHGGRADKTVIEISEKGGFAEVSLTDNGNGFPRSVLDASKKKFSDIELIKDTDSSRGIGIGLALCDTIIKAHGGKISLSNTSEGARVVFTLPIYEVDYGEQVKDIDS